VRRFELHGEAVIETVRKSKPADYLRIVAALVPKELSVEGGSLEDLSDEELAQAIADIRILAAALRCSTLSQAAEKSVSFSLKPTIKR
jgi:hypothetical protein